MKYIIAITFLIGAISGILIMILINPDTSALALSFGVLIGVMAGVPTCLMMMKIPRGELHQHVHINRRIDSNHIIGELNE